MDTNWKKSKKIRAFCYRVIAMGALAMTVLTGIMGREAFENLYREGPAVLSGDVYYLPEFREYVAQIYNAAMVGYGGAGDDAGFPLKGAYAEQYSAKQVAELEKLTAQTGEDIAYYIQKTGNDSGRDVVRWNVSYPFFSENEGNIVMAGGNRLCIYWDGETGKLQFFGKDVDAQNADEAVAQYYTPQYRPSKEGMANIRLVVTVRDECTSNKMQWIQWRAAKYRRILLLCLGNAILWLVFAILSLITGKAGKKAAADWGNLTAKVWLEGKLLVVALAVWGIIRLDLAGFSQYQTVRIQGMDRLWGYFPLGCLLYLFYMDIRQNGIAVLVNSLPGRACHAVKTFVKSKNSYRRAMFYCFSMLVAALVLLVCGGVLCYLPVSSLFIQIAVRKILTRIGRVMLFVGAVLLYCFWRQSRLLKDMGAVMKRLSQMSRCEETTEFTLPDNSLLASAAKDLNELENGIENAVEQKNRSNRMRVELLTNVSHDLKTPLTSIINYADLLCEEELSETAAGYAAALQNKAYRLKNMVQDVFDLSKATSGNLPVEKTSLDLVKLIRQTLADMDERIQGSGLSFKVHVAEEPLMIQVDGNRLYRVFQNLFVNALQYSLEGSRVHVTLLAEDGYAVAKVKNISRTDLDFDPAEIMERFVRADTSRTTEGSGLGLSIVQSFTEACGGTFTIETDADMFTACVRFPLVAAEPAMEDTPLTE